MNKIPRRQFIRNSLLATAAFKAWPLLAQSSTQSRIIGANDDIRVAVVGFNGRGKSHIEAFSAMKGTRSVRSGRRRLARMFMWRSPLRTMSGKAGK